MPGLERLAKLKDYRNTSVIVSNHRYAAAAVMGQRNGRAQLAGPYFRLRTQASSSSHAHTPNVEGRSTDVQIDLKRDWADFMKEYARSTKVGFDASASFADMTVQYLNTVRRLPAPRTRRVYESCELEIPPAHGADYAALRELIETGVNLRPYLARNLQDKNKVPRPDKLLSAWGIHHLHLQPGGSDLVLLCKITDDAVFMIHAANHFGTAGLELWVNPELLRVVHENWPEELAECRFNLTSATPPVEDRIVVRRNNANFTVTMPDGTAYFSLLTAIGHCMDDRDRCRDIGRELAVFEQFIRDNAREFRAGLNWPDASSLTIRMGFNGRDCFLYEPNNGTEIHPSRSPI